MLKARCGVVSQFLVVNANHTLYVLGSIIFRTRIFFRKTISEMNLFFSDADLLETFNFLKKGFSPFNFLKDFDEILHVPSNKNWWIKINTLLLLSNTFHLVLHSPKYGNFHRF